MNVGTACPEDRVRETKHIGRNASCNSQCDCQIYYGSSGSVMARSCSSSKYNAYWEAVRLQRQRLLGQLTCTATEHSSNRTASSIHCIRV